MLLVALGVSSPTVCSSFLLLAPCGTSTAAASTGPTTTKSVTAIASAAIAVDPLHHYHSHSRSAILNSMDIMCLGNMVSGLLDTTDSNNVDRDDESLFMALERSILQQRSLMQTRIMQLDATMQLNDPFSMFLSRPTGALAHKNVMSDMELMCITNQIPFVFVPDAVEEEEEDDLHTRAMERSWGEQLQAISARLQQDRAIASSRIHVLDESLWELTDNALYLTATTTTTTTRGGGGASTLSSPTHESNQQQPRHDDDDGQSLMESIRHAVFTNSPNTRTSSRTTDQMLAGGDTTSATDIGS